MDDYITVKQAAALMNVHPMTFYRFVWAGEIDRINIGQGKSRPRYRVRRSKVDALMSSREKAGKAA